MLHWVSWKRNSNVELQNKSKAQRKRVLIWEEKQRHSWVLKCKFQNESCGFDFDEDAPWKLNIVIIDAIYEKATVKENFLINF